ncbi:nectin-1-like [Cyprinus carpio]|uniref:Nectin-1-like n=1 Tax=Cyprinus carpio TaxID=7962 RepID=A0A9Q9YY05_CYPCA|nr:nectin-1-like [Cyprinus carpio]
MMDLQNVIIPLLLSYTTVFTVLHGQKVVTDLKVTGYQGHDVTLLCQYINGNTEDKILQMQWTWQNESSKYEIMVFSMDHGLSLHDTFLKDRVSFRKSSPPIYEASIIIKDVKMSDQGVYSCAYTTFPSGSHTGQTTLTVLEDTTQSPSDLQDVTYSDVTILKPGKANRSTSQLSF